MKRQFLCDMHSLMSVGFLIHLFMNGFLPGFFSICFCNLMMFYDWRECVNFDIKNTPRAVELTLGNKVVLYCCSLVEH